MTVMTIILCALRTYTGAPDDDARRTGTHRHDRHASQTAFQITREDQMRKANGAR
jgi:hypothetical protein